MRRVYDLLSCSEGPEGNQDRSYLTFLSSDSIMFGVINIVGKLPYLRLFPLSDYSLSILYEIILQRVPERFISCFNNYQIRLSLYKFMVSLILYHDFSDLSHRIVFIIS